MSNLSELLPTGGGQNAVDFVASGTLASGQTVALKTNGQVEAVSSTGKSFSENVGTEAQFEASSFNFGAAVFDAAAGKVVLVYKDEGNSSYGTAIVGTVSGDTISYGSPVVFLAATASQIAACYDSVNEKVVVFYSTGTTGYAIVGTVSGTSISFGSAVQYTTQNPAYQGVSFDTSAEKTVTAFTAQSNGSYATAIVGTVSGTSISFGSAVVFRSANTQEFAPVYDTNANKTVIVYRESSVTGAGEGIVGTVSGTSISFGSAVQFDTAPVTEVRGAFDPDSNQIICAYTKVTAKVVLGTVSGTSISFGAIVSAPGASSGSDNNGVCYDTQTNKIVLAYADGTSSGNGRIATGTVSGTTLSFASPAATFNGSYITKHTFATFDSTNNKVVVGYEENNASGEALVFQAAGSGPNNTSFIGITAEAISNTATGAVNVYGGINTAQTGLTIASDYYVQADGSLAAGATSIPFDIASAVYVQNFSILAQDNSPSGLAFNADGTKMFVLGYQNDSVNEYALSTGFDVSTASFTDAFSVSSQDTIPYGLAFSPDGTKMFVVGYSGQDVNEYTLSTGFDVSTASFVDSFSVSSQDTQPAGVAFNTDGTKMFVSGITGQDINEYTLSAGFDVSTASFVDSFSVSSQDTSPSSLTFNADGTQMFVCGQTGGDINEYALSTGFDVSTASYTQVFSLATYVVRPVGIAFNANGTKMFVLGQGSGDNNVNEFTTTQTTFTTTVKAGQAISATTINMKDLT